ncbi:MAG: hypothetical protein ABF904_11610 [Ethanoligenens sp.]
MDSTELIAVEKQIAKEILLKMIDKDALRIYAPSSNEDADENVKNVLKAYSEILKTLTE